MENQAAKPFENNTESESKVDSGVHHVHLHGENHEELGEYYMHNAESANLPGGEDQVNIPDHSVTVDNKKGEDSDHSSFPGLVRKIR